MIKFNRAYRKTLEVRQQFESDRAEEIRTVIKETDRLYHVWDAVRDARCDYYYVTVRRQALKKLKDLIGEDAYKTGELPPNVPTWRFRGLSEVDSQKSLSNRRPFIPWRPQFVGVFIDLFVFLYR